MLSLQDVGPKLLQWLLRVPNSIVFSAAVLTENEEYRRSEVLLSEYVKDKCVMEFRSGRWK